jgi:hypothetical protein
MTHVCCGEQKTEWDLGKYEVVITSFLRPLVAIPETPHGEQGSMMQRCMKPQAARAESVLFVMHKYEAVFWSHNPNSKSFPQSHPLHLPHLS